MFQVKIRKADADDFYDFKQFVNPMKKLHTKIELVQQFSDIICDVLKECTFVSKNPCTEDNDVGILFPTYDDEFLLIGCIKGRDYLFDSEFIYRRVLKYSPKGTRIPSQTEYYSDLFRIGILKPYERFFPNSDSSLDTQSLLRICIAKALKSLEIQTKFGSIEKPLFKIKLEEISQKKWCFCIPRNFITLDIDTLKWV